LSLSEKYHFITVEGNTGAGKTSLARMLAKQYKGNLILEEFVDNPFLPKFYAQPARYAFHTEAFFLLDRHEQLNKLIASGQLKKGLNITDYLFNKSLLYAKVNLDPDENKLFARFFHTLHQHLPQPELVVYVHATVPRLIQNIRQRGRGFEQQVRPEYLQEVEDIYFNYFRKNPQLRVLVIHADNMDFVHNPAHYTQIVKWLQSDYPPGINEVKLVE